MSRIHRGDCVRYIGNVDCLRNLVGRVGYCMLDDVDVVFPMSATDGDDYSHRYTADVKVSCKIEELEIVNKGLYDNVEFVKVDEE